MERQEILKQLSDRSVYPADAIAYCLKHPARTTAIFLPLLTRVGQGHHLPPDEHDAVFLGLHLLADLQITEAFPPLLKWSTEHPDHLLRLLGEDCVGTVFARILISLGPGQKEALWEVVEATDIDFLIRDAFLRAWTFEVMEDRVSQVGAVRQLTQFLDGNAAPPSDDPIWVGWMTAIADLGYRDLIPVVQRAVEAGRILSDEGALADKEFRDFDATLQETSSLEGRSRLQLERGYVPFGELQGDWGEAFLLAPSVTHSQ